MLGEACTDNSILEIGNFIINALQAHIKRAMGKGGQRERQYSDNSGGGNYGRGYGSQDGNYGERYGDNYDHGSQMRTFDGQTSAPYQRHQPQQHRGNPW